MEVLRRKLDNLMRGDEGVALVITLALFMFLYVSIAGVFTVGRVIKDKIALQNAVDAAAYSAAIVEADTLSKIATNNRAMAWTYYSMVINQMNYIVWKWLTQSYDDYLKDAARPGLIYIGGMDNQSPSYIDLQKTNTVQIAVIKTRLDEVAEEVEKWKRDIVDQRDWLTAMNKRNKELRDGLKDEIEDVVVKILKANLPDGIGDYCLFNLERPAGDDILTSPDEETFLGFENFSISDFPNNGLWFPCVPDGISRSYAGTLLSQWLWRTLYDSRSPSVDAIGLWDKYFEGRPAEPLVLKGDYFSQDKGGCSGAISVAVAMKARNPWKEMFGIEENESSGFYDVFEPNTDNMSDVDTRAGTDWIYAVASAQAGFRPFRKYDDDDDDSGEKDENDVNDDRNYSLVEDPRENLRTDDWDAVFVPVRRALSGKFEDFMKPGSAGWNRLDTASGIALNYEDKGPTALPRMHNNHNKLKNLYWEREGDEADLLKLIYH